MFQIEIFEYTAKLTDFYSHFHNTVNQGEAMSTSLSFTNHHLEDTIENKFYKIKKVKSPLICQYIDLIKEDNNYIFVSETNGDSLDGVIDAKLSENAAFKVEEVVKILFQLIYGIRVLERNGICLRFIEPRRVLINEEMIQIQNYIVDILFKPEELKYINNIKYIAPELIFFPENSQTCKATIWSVGIIALELLSNIQKFPSHQNLFFYFSSNDFIKDYIEILLKYKDSSILLKTEKNVDYSCKNPRLLLEYYLNGHFMNKADLEGDLIDFICECLQIDPEKRKDSSSLLFHPIFNQLRSNTEFINKIDKRQYTLLPLDKETLQTKLNDEIKQQLKMKLASSYDNYSIFRNVLKIDLITFLKKKGAITYKPKIMGIPSYFSLYCSSDESPFPGYDDDEEMTLEEKIKPVSKIKEGNTNSNTNTNTNTLSSYDAEFNVKEYNEGCLIFIGTYVITLPLDYEKDASSLENFIKNSIYDLQLFKSEAFSIISDKSSSSSQKSKLSLKDPKEMSISTALLSKTSSGKLSTSSIDKDLYNYFRIKNLTYNIILQTNTFKREDLIAEVKKNNYSIPHNFRQGVYLILLEIDYFNDREEFELGGLYENRSFNHEEMAQIKRDIIRCEEYDHFFKTEEGKNMLSSILEGLIYNRDDFFYCQGMDSIVAAIVKLCDFDVEMAYQVFYKLTKKLLFQFYDEKNKTIKDLKFHHLIISRLLAFLDPELYLYLVSIGFLEDQFASTWILTLFSRTFKFETVFKIWDVLLIENINLIYIFICFILIESKSYIMNNSKELIMKDFNEISDFVKIDQIIQESVKCYRYLPQSIIPMYSDFQEEELQELKKNEFFKNRWWDFYNFYTEEFNVPILTLDDVIKIYDRALFIDIRIQLEYEKLKIKDSFHLNLNKGKYYDTCINAIEKNNGSKIFVLIGSKNSNFMEVVNFLLKKKIKMLCILQGGIDIVFIDEESLIIKKY